MRGGEVLLPRAERVERKAQHPRLQDRGYLRDRRAGQRHRAGLRFQLRQIGGGKGVEVFILLPQAQRRLADVLDRLRVDPAEPRQHLRADKVARERRVRVSRVRAIGHMMLLRVGGKLLPRQAEEGAHQPAVFRRDARKARHARAAGKMKEHRFGVVVRVMGGDDARRAGLTGNGVKEVVAQLARRLLDCQAVLPGVGRHIARADAQRDTPRCAPRTHEVLVHVGLLPAQLMVVVRRAHAVAVFV